MIPRAIVARTLGLPADTEVLPPGDLPLARFMARYIAYLGTSNPGTETPDAWAGAVMDHLMADAPDLALEAILAGLALENGHRLADPLAELGQTGAIDVRIAAEAETNPALSELIAQANAAQE
ncbi:MAG: hypothetical protein AAGF30_02245 [Pseudomonadota bacterium]